MIQKVINNIDSYDAVKHGVGGMGVLRTTGPIAYTLAIVPLLKEYPHRFINIQKEFKFGYSCLEQYEHRKLSKTHYTVLKEPVIL